MNDSDIIDTAMLVLKNFGLYDHGYDEEDLSDIGEVFLTALSKGGYAIVKLPESELVWKVLIDGEVEDLYPSTQNGDICLSGYLRVDPSEARALGAALLAATNAVEADQ